MSMPVFPNTNITRENAINQILSSIAMEELSLSHILNAEGEKIQHVLGTLTGQTTAQNNQHEKTSCASRHGRFFQSSLRPVLFLFL